MSNREGVSCHDPNTVRQCFIAGLEPMVPKKLVIRISAPLSRQPLVKGERLVRYEVSAAMPCKTVSEC